MVRIRSALGGFLGLLIGMLVVCGSASAAGIRVVPSAARVMPGGDFYVDIVADNIPADGLGGVQFRLNVTASGGSVTGVTDLSQAGPNDIAVASPLLASPPTATRSGIGDFFWNGRSANGILVLDNEPLTNGSGLYTFAHTSGATPPSGSGTIARFLIRVGSGVTADRVDIGLSDVMLLDGGPAYPLDYATGASVQLRCMTTVPSLLGLDPGQAQAALAAANLLEGSIYELDNHAGTHPLNVVLEQSEPAGGSVYCQTPVNLAINTPPAEVTQAKAADQPGNDTGGVLLSWVPSTTADAAGYRVYLGTSLLTDVGNATATGTGLGGLPNGISSLVRVTAYDTFGNESPGVIVSATPIDDVPPAVTVSGVAEGAYYRTDVTPQVGISDTNLASQSITLNGAPFTPAPVTADGSYTLTATGADSAGNQTTKSVHFVLDKTPPTITVANVTDGGFYNTDPAPAVTVTDANLQGSSVTLNGQPYVPGTPISAEGAYILSVSADDLAGNTATQAVTFVVDKTPPVSTAAVAQPQYTNSGVTYISGQTPLTITAQDPGDAPSGVAGIDYVLDGAQGAAAYSAPVTLAGVADGSHTVTYEAYDRATNRESARSLTLTVDNTPPATALAAAGPDFSLTGGVYAATSATQFTLAATDSLSGVAKTEYRIDGGAWLPYAPFSLSGEGTHTIDYRSADNLGNTETVRSRSELIDNTPPVSTLTVGTLRYTAADGTLYAAATTTFTITAADTLSGVARTEYRVDGGAWTPYAPFSLTTEGSHTIGYRSVDNVGNVEVEKSLAVTIDATPPATAIHVGTPQYVGADGAVYATAATQFTLSAADTLSGVARTEYRVDGGAWTAYAPFTVTTEGSHTIGFRSVDNVGNVEVEKSLAVTIDTTPPVTTIATGAPHYVTTTGATYATAATQFTLAATDTLSGVARTEYRVDGGAWTAYAPFSLTTEGSHTIGFRSVDNVGNVEAEKNLTVTIDNTPPVTAITTGVPQFMAADGTLYGTAATQFTLSATDTLSGVGGTEYRVDGGAWTPYVPFTIATEGKHVIGYRSTDNVGNVEVEKSLTVVIDTTPPVTAIHVGTPQFVTASGATYATAATSFTLSAADTLSGVAKTEYRIDGGAWTPYAPFTVTTEGSHTIGFRSVDNVGNVEVEKSLTVVIDTTPPVSLVTVAAEQYAADGNLYVSGVTAITIAATDAGSGVKGSEYSLDGAPYVAWSGPITLAAYPEGSHTIAYRSVDNVGNVEAARTLTVVLDKSPPKSAITGSDPLTTGVVNTVSPRTTYTLAATDNLSGVKGTWYRIDAGPWQLYSAGFSLTGLAAGTHVISFDSVDNVGNEEPAQSVTVRLVVFTVKKEVSLAPVVLVSPRKRCDGDGEGDEAKTSGPDPVATLLDATGVAYYRATDAEDFIRALRSGRYNVYLLTDDWDRGDGDGEAELLEGVYYGDGLIYVKTVPDNADAALNGIFGASFTGESANSDLLLTIPEGPLGPAATLTTAGKTVIAKTVASTATVLGTVTDHRGEYPALVLAGYGRGKALLFTFDLAATPDGTKAAALLSGVLNLATPAAHPLRAQESVPIRIEVTNSTEPVGLQVAETIPTTTTADTITPPGTQSANVITWQQFLGASATATFGYDLNLPDAKGGYTTTTATGYANYGTYYPYASQELTLTVAHDSAELLQQAITDLFALPASCKKESRAIADAVAALQQICQAATTGEGAEENVERILTATGDLTELTADTSGVRSELDELLKVWERKWYLLSAQEAEGGDD